MENAVSYFHKVLSISVIILLFLSGCASKIKTPNETTKKDNLKETNANPKPEKENARYLKLKVGPSPLSPISSDFNNDGFTDIAAISHGDNKMVIFWGGPKRTFRKGPVYGKDSVGYHPGKIVAVDWNGDGLQDIILAAEGLFQVQYWKNTGDGFEKKATVQVPINCESIKCADLDGDGDRDIVLSSHQGNIILILWGKKGEFLFDPQAIPANKMARNIETGDWNHDKNTDIYWVEVVPGSVVVALNKGERKFSKYYLKRPGKPVGLAKDAPAFVKTADLNGDGCEDAAVTFEVLKEQGCTIFYGNCQGQVASKEYIEAPVWGFSGLAVTVPQNGPSPLIALGEEGRIFIAHKIGTKWKLVEKPAGSLPRDLSFADLDNDGNQDLLFANAAGDSIGLLFGPLVTPGQNQTVEYQK